MANEWTREDKYEKTYLPDQLAAEAEETRAGEFQRMIQRLQSELSNLQTDPNVASFCKRNLNLSYMEKMLLQKVLPNFRNVGRYNITFSHMTHITIDTQHS